MLEFFVRCRRRQARLQNGPFCEVLKPLAEWLRQQGYSQESGSFWFLTLQHFGAWFNSKGYARGELCQQHVSQFLAERKRRQPTPKGREDDRDGRRSIFPKAMSLLASMRGEADPDVRSQRAAALAPYESHLRDRCGLADDTVHRNLKVVREFHRFAFGAEEEHWRAIKPNIVLDFFRNKASQAKSMRNLPGYLWHYLRFLQLQGHEVKKLMEVLPRIRKPAKPPLYKVLTSEQSAQWLAGFDRSQAEGRRDYAMALCLADLGMRVGDLAALRLDDIDWKQGAIRIPNTKRHRPYWLPLPKRVGQAVAFYLRKVRPASMQREVFLRHRSPRLKPLTAVYILHRLRDAALAQGLKSPLIGTHAFRHTFATRLLRNGSSLKQVADMLGHEDIRSTTVYANLDPQTLSLAVRSWPEGQS